MRILLSHFLLLVAGTVFSQQPASSYKIDTSRVAILPATEYVSRAIQTTISDDELQSAEMMVSEAFGKMGKEINRPDCHPVSYMSFYKRQYFPVMENDQKVVYVNCFIDESNKFWFWKKHVVFSTGGGLVHIKLNLNKKECISFEVSRPCFSKLKILKLTVEASVL